MKTDIFGLETIMYSIKYYKKDGQYVINQIKEFMDLFICGAIKKGFNISRKVCARERKFKA